MTTYRKTTRVAPITPATVLAGRVATRSFLGALLAVGVAKLGEAVGLRGAWFAALAGLGMLVALAAVVAGAVARYLAGGLRAAVVEVGAFGVRVDGVQRVPAKDVRRVAFEPHVTGGKGQVSVFGRDGALAAQFYVDSADDVVLIRRALGLSADGAATSTDEALREHAVQPSWSGKGAVLVTLAVVAAVVIAGVATGLASQLWGPSTGRAVMAGSTLCMALLAGTFLSRQRARVGADGVAIPGRGFVAWSDVSSIEARGNAVVLHTVRGEIRLQPSSSDLGQFEARALLRADLDAGLERHRRAQHADLSARLERRGRPRAAWLEELLGTREGFRTAAMSEEQLERVAADPTSAPTARAGAALLLARSGGGLRVAAETCAEPKLRVVLEKASSAEPAAAEELEDAVAEVDERAP